MKHARVQIRDAFKEALKELATTKRNCFTSRIHALTEKELPALTISIGNEDSQPINIASQRRLERMMTIQVEGFVKMTTKYEDTIEKIAREVEAAIYIDPSLNTMVKDIVLQSTERAFSGESDLPTAIITLSYAVVYNMLEGAPETIIS
jgi:hypothetical protein